MKKTVAALMLSVLALALSGCIFTAPEATLYRLPKLAGEYESLEARIDTLLAMGGEYAAPTSGSNLQSVQMIDLDSDGVEEAVAFFRFPNDKKPMKIYIFKAEGDSYEQYACIEGTSTLIYSVNYADLDGDGRREILVGYRSSSDVQGLSIYPMTAGSPEALLIKGYSRYANIDMNGDGKQELLILCSDTESVGRVDYYDWADGTLAMRYSMRLSLSLAEVSRLTVGTLAGGENALFVTEVTADNLTVTDVLALRSGRLQNVALGPDGDRMPEGTAFLGLFPRDENDDGVTEVPEAREMQCLDEEGERQYYVVWRQYSADGTAADVQSCYHNVEDGWNLKLPEEWSKEKLAAERTVGADESAVSFYRVGADGSRKKVLTIYRLTGSMREELAGIGDRFTLTRQVEAVYAAEIGDTWNMQLTEQSLRDRFSLIMAEWTMGDN